MGANRPARRWKYWTVVGALAVAATAGTVVLNRTGYLRLIHLKARDLHFVLRGAHPTSDIALVVIDQKSLDTFRDPLLFWHPYYADAIQAAAGAGARVLALDVTFAIPVEDWVRGLDQKMAEAVIANAARMPVICAYVPSTLNLQDTRPVPLNMAAGAMGLAAFANLRVDSDDFVREAELLEQPAGDAPPVRSLAARAAETFLGATTEVRHGQVYLAGAVPTTEPRTLRINYAGPAGTFPRHSLSDVVLAYRAGRTDQLRQWLGGKAVLLGMDSIEDRHATPFYVLAAGRRANTAGVEIQASVLDTLIHRRFLVDVPAWVGFGALALTVALVALATGRLTGSRLSLTLLSGAVVLGAASHWLFRSGWVLADSELLLGAVLSAGPVLAYRSLSAERRGSLFQRAVAVFVGGTVADALDRTEQIGRSGERLQVTILFSDIRGFTAFCEEKDPQVVVDLLNHYMETMVAVIVKYRGQVNKFIGDGIMAIFSDLDGSAPGDHAERAVRCACEMVQKPGQFRTGTGIHSGVVVVGVIGSKDKMEYTALGDTVNLASRLESLNKEHKTHLLISEETRLLLPAGFQTVCLGEVAVRGKTVPMKLHTVEGLHQLEAVES